MNSRWIALALLAAAWLAPATLAAAEVEPLASVETNWDGLTIDLISVVRKANVLTVKWAVRNGGEEQQEVHFFLEQKGARTYAVDEESGTKYYVLTDQEGQLLASEHEYHGILEKVPPGKSKRFWMKLPAPPPEVKVLTVFFDQTEPFEAVPITDQ